ncbi:hypothetical protein [Nostoc sp.]|uniref:hypothetical protein n=1 Tax=Nostoc sp. TaxID=1180 RepID=UPI002FF8579B
MRRDFILNFKEPIHLCIYFSFQLESPQINPGAWVILVAIAYSRYAIAICGKCTLNT